LALQRYIAERSKQTTNNEARDVFVRSRCSNVIG
jgi:hypothetical protein